MANSEEIKKQILSKIKDNKKNSILSKEYFVSETYGWKRNIKGIKIPDKKIIKNNNEEESAFNDIKILRKQGRYEEAREVAEKFPESIKVQSQMIKVLEEEGNLKDALEIGKRFSDNKIIQSQMIKILIKQGNLEKAKEIAKRFLEYDVIQSQMITILIRQGKIKEAKEMGKLQPENPVIQSQMVSILIKEGNMEEAKRIGKKFPENEFIRAQMATILMQEESIDIAENLNKLLNEIYNNPNNPEIREKIDKFDDNWVKVILYTALAEKTNSQGTAQKFIKDLKKAGNVDEEHRPTIKALEQRLQQKSKIFDIEFYSKVFKKLQNKKRTTPQNSER